MNNTPELNWIPTFKAMPIEYESTRSIYDLSTLEVIDNAPCVTSGNVLVTVYDFASNKLFVDIDRTVYGEWERFGNTQSAVVAWASLPQPYQSPHQYGEN